MLGKIRNKYSIIICVFVFMLVPMNVRADVGPKPSIHIVFEGLGKELCYGTLLSQNDSTGPSSAWDGTEESVQHNENESYSYAELDYETWKAFVEYEDVDGYFFLQEGWRVDETKELAWTYYPPPSFKILLYFPEQGVFVSSGIYERYAFDSYYTVDMSGIVPFGTEEGSAPLLAAEIMEAEQSYDYGREIPALLIRIAVTILIEMGVAFLFRFRRKKELRFLTIVNVLTQIVLNVLLNLINYSAGWMAFVFGYVLLEIAVFGIEAVLYSRFLRGMSEQPMRKSVYVLYAFVANAVSFVAGFAIARAVPGIF